MCVAIALAGCQALMGPSQPVQKVTPEQAPEPPVVKATPEPEQPQIREDLPVTIKKIESRREYPLGYWRSAQVGDFLLGNDKLQVVISDIDRKTDFAPHGGTIIDIANKTDTMDYFGEMQFTGITPKFESYEIVVPQQGDDEYTLRLKGASSTRPDIRITQDYTITPDDPTVKVTTLIDNNTTQPLDISMKDNIVWGGARLFVGGRGTPPTQKKVEVKTDWMCGRIDNYSVGLTAPVGTLNTENYKNASDVVYKKSSIPAGSRSKIERYLYVADKDISKITAYMLQLRNKPQGIISGTVVDTADEKPVEDVEVRVRCNRLEGEVLPAYPYTVAYSDENGEFEVMVQSGSYYVLAHPMGRTAAKRALSLNIPEGGTVVTKLQVSPEITLSYEIRDAETGELIPAKLTFISLPGKPFLKLGSAFEMPGSYNTYYAHEGKGEITLPPQLFKIIVSRGVEYDTVEKEMRIVPGKQNELNVELERVIDSTGYIAADIGVRTRNSYDSPVSARERVRAAVCEGVEWLVSGDANTATDLQQAIDGLGLQQWITASRGINLEFFGDDIPGDFLLFPVDDADEALLREQMDTLAGSSPGEFFLFLHETFPQSLVQVNSPLDPERGYFALHGYSLEKENELPDPSSCSYDFDLLEIWSGKQLKEAENNLKLYNALQNQGYTNAFGGGSHARMIYGEETGYPRMFIQSSTDDPAAIDVDELVANLEAGKVVLSNGPLIHFNVDDQEYSSLVVPDGQRIDCSLEILAAPWVNVNVININREGNFVKWIFLPPLETVHRYPRKKTEPEIFKISSKEEAFMNSIVKGGKSLEPVVSPLSYPEGTPMMPFAISGPIYIDQNGNGTYDPSPEE